MESLVLSISSSKRRIENRSKFKKFLEENRNPFVSERTDEEILSAIEEQSLFFVQDASDRIIATTAFYLHGVSDLWGELGSTLVKEEFRGLQLQPIMYKQIIAFKHMAEPLDNIFAVVDELAVPSFTNIEKVGLERLKCVPQDLAAITPTRNWPLIEQGVKRFYKLGRPALAASLNYVAEHGDRQELKDKQGRSKYRLEIDFSYLKNPLTRDALRSEARRMLG